MTRYRLLIDGAPSPHTFATASEACLWALEFARLHADWRWEPVTDLCECGGAARGETHECAAPLPRMDVPEMYPIEPEVVR